jgi:CheY-like chemotaxis protein
MLAVRNGRRPLILVADPNEIIRQVIRTILVGQGCRVLFAHNGEAAVRVIKRLSSRLDLMIVDMSIEATRGFDIADHAAQLAPGLPVVLLSSRLLEGSPAQQYLGPRREIVAKPFTQASLLSKVRDLLADPTRTNQYKTVSRAR